MRYEDVVRTALPVRDVVPLFDGKTGDMVIAVFTETKPDVAFRLPAEMGAEFRALMSLVQPPPADKPVPTFNSPCAACRGQSYKVHIAIIGWIGRGAGRSPVPTGVFCSNC